MKNLLVVLMLMAIPVMAEEVTPNQEIDNTKSYTGINYNRQDSEQTGVQKIVNDHSWFNINIQIIKKGALFKGKDIVVETEAKQLLIWGCLVLTGYTDHRLQVETYDLLKSYKNIDADNVIYADFGNRTALAA